MWNRLKINNGVGANRHQGTGTLFYVDLLTSVEPFRPGNIDNTSSSIIGSISTGFIENKTKYCHRHALKDGSHHWDYSCSLKIYEMLP